MGTSIAAGPHCAELSSAEFRFFAPHRSALRLRVFCVTAQASLPDRLSSPKGASSSFRARLPDLRLAPLSLPDYQARLIRRSHAAIRLSAALLGLVSSRCHPFPRELLALRLEPPALPAPLTDWSGAAPTYAPLRFQPEGSIPLDRKQLNGQSHRLPAEIGTCIPFLPKKAGRFVPITHSLCTSHTSTTTRKQAIQPVDNGDIEGKCAFSGARPHFSRASSQRKADSQA